MTPVMLVMTGLEAQYVPQKGPSDGLSDGPEVCKDIPMALYKIHFPQGSAISPLLAYVLGAVWNNISIFSISVSKRVKP